MLKIALLLFIFQLLYSGFYMLRGRSLSKQTHVGKFEIGSKENKELKVLVDGDSVGAGVGATSFNESLAGRIAKELSNKYFVVMNNQSVSGSKMKDLINRDLPDEKQDLVILVISSNDLFRFTDYKIFDESTKKVLDRYSKIGDKVIIVGPGRVFDAAAIPILLKPIYKKRAEVYAQIIDKHVKEHKNITHVNPISTSIDPKKYGPTGAMDRFHPNNEGYRFWFDLVKPHL